MQVTVTAEQPLTAFDTLCCHCDNCKRRSGGVASYAFAVPQEHVVFEPPPEDEGVDNGAAAAAAAAEGKEGPNPHRTFVDRATDSGKLTRRTMCAECGSPVCIVEAHAPDIRCLQYGLFAGVIELPRPELEMFVAKRVAWVREVGNDIRDTT